MELLLSSLGIYLVGTLTILWPKRLELAAHYAGMLCAIVASGMVAWSALSYLTNPVSAWLIEWHWGDYSLLGDTWSAAFLLLAGIAGVFISIYALDYGEGYLG